MHPKNVYKVSTRVVIDFQTAGQNALAAGGMVNGEYQGNMADGWLSLSTAVSSFEKDGTICVVTPNSG